MPSTETYISQIETGAHLVAQRIGHKRWTMAYQSRSGPPQVPWLEPDIGEVLKELASNGASHVVVVPIGFVCDHVEVLYDLDTEAQRIAQQRGLNMIRAQTVNDHPVFIQMLADVVLKTMDDGSESARS